MAADKYTALWLSHSSISDFLKCPRAYYLKNIYKDPKTGHKIQLMTPPLALGQAVHEVIESLSIIPTENRFNESLLIKFNTAWDKVSGKRGGFLQEDTEHKYKQRGEIMLKRVMDNPGPLKNLAIKIKVDNRDLPYFWLSEEDNIILCGKLDWIEYFPDTDSIHIIDFKTSKSVEDPESLQLPIYSLLAHKCQNRKVDGASYWYLEENDAPTPKTLPGQEEAEAQILKIARKVKLARQLESFKCPEEEKGDGCMYCKSFEAILRGELNFVYTDSNNRDVYIYPEKEVTLENESIIL